MFYILEMLARPNRWPTLILLIKLSLFPFLTGELKYKLEKCTNTCYAVESNGITIICKGGMEGVGYIYSVQDGKYVRSQLTLYGFNLTAITSDGKYVS